MNTTSKMIYMVSETGSNEDTTIHGLFEREDEARLYRERLQVLDPWKTFDLSEMVLWHGVPYPHMGKYSIVTNTEDEEGLIPEPHVKECDPYIPQGLPSDYKFQDPLTPPEKFLTPFVPILRNRLARTPSVGGETQEWLPITGFVDGHAVVGESHA